MIKTSKLWKRVWFVAISVIAITLMSFAVSFATEAQETSVDNTQDQAVVAEEVAAAEEAVTGDNATPVHVNLNVADLSIRLVCHHFVVVDYLNVKEEFFEINPAEGITFEHPLVTKETPIYANKIDVENIGIKAGLNVEDGNTEKFEIAYAVSNQSVGIAFNDPVYSQQDSTVSISFLQANKFIYSVYLGYDDGKSVGEGYKVPFYTADGTCYKTGITDAEGSAVFELDREHAMGYVYDYDASKKLSYFDATFNYKVDINENGEVVAVCESECELGKPTVFLLGNEHHSNFVYSFFVGIEEVKIYDYYFNVKELILPATSILPMALNTNDYSDIIKMNVEADGTLALDTTGLLPEEDSSCGLSFKPIAENGSVFDNWNVMGSTYLPNSKITIDTSDFEKDDVVDIYANYKLVEASEIAQTSDVTPFAAGVVASFAVIAGLSLLALRKQH